MVSVLHFFFFCYHNLISYGVMSQTLLTAVLFFCMIHFVFFSFPGSGQFYSTQHASGQNQNSYWGCSITEMPVRANSWNTALIVSWRGKRTRLFQNKTRSKSANGQISVEIVHNESSSSRSDGFLPSFSSRWRC